MGARESLDKQLRATSPEALAASIIDAGRVDLLEVPLERARALGLRWPEPLLTLSMRLLPPAATLRQVLDDASWWREVAKRRVPIGGPLGHIAQWFEEITAENALVRTIPDDVRAWATLRGVGPMLELVFDGVLAGARADGEDRARVGSHPGMTLATVLEAEAVDGDIVDDASRALAWQKIASEARDRVRALAEESQPPPKPPEDAKAKLLFDALGELRNEIRASATPRTRERTRRGALTGPDRLAAASIRITYVDAERIYTDGLLRSPEVSLVIRELDPAGLDVSCTCPGEGRCTHALAALDDLRGMLSGAPWGFARSIIALLDELSRPIEARVDRVLEQLVSRASLGDEEVAFGWIVSDVVGIQLQPAVQRRGKRGHLLQPRRATTADLTAMPRHLLSPMDTVLLDTTVAPKSHGASASLGGTDALRSIERLIGHPRVWHEGQWERPLEVRAAKIEVSLGARDDGRIALGVALDGRALAGRALLELLDELEDGRSAWLDLANGKLSVLALDPDTITLLELAVATAHALPSDARARIEPALGALVARLPIALGEGFRGPSVDASFQPTVRLAMLDGGGVHLSLVVRPIAGCVPQIPGEGPDILIGRGSTGPIHTARDRAREREEATNLAAALGLSDGSWRNSGERVDAIERALEVIERLRSQPEIEVEWSSPRRIKVRGMPPDPKIELTVSGARDWFGVEGKIALDDTVLELAAVVEALRRGESYVRVGPDEWVRIDEALRARLQPLVDAASIDKGAIVVPRVSARALLPLIEEADEADVAPELHSMIARVSEAEAFDVSAMKPRVTAELREYQIEGWAWLTRLSMWGAGACLADDMGLGKTLQALAVLVDRGAKGPQIVIAPTSVVGNWRRETARFAPDLRAVVYREGDRKEILARLGPGDLLIASYGILVRDAEALQAVTWTTLVLDEAQAVKNADTQRAKAARSLDAGWRLALTGTPIENHLGELWSLFDLISPGLLGKEREFRERFVAPIERAKDSERRLALARIVRPFILRRTKSEVARDLPARTEMTLEVELSPAEAQLYEDARRAAVARVGGLATEGEQSRFQVLAEIMRLRQLACHPRLVYPDETATSSKLETALALIDTLRREGHRALIFSQFTRHLALLRAALDEAKVPYLYLDGATAGLEREKRVERFQAGEGELFLISLKAGGTGLNLTGADYVLHLDPWWNPSVEDQATDRAHRIGQTRPVTVYRLISKGTIEERILTLHAEKRALVASVLEGSDAAATLDTEALIELITEGQPKVAVRKASQKPEPPKVDSQKPAALKPEALKPEPPPKAERPEPPAPKPAPIRLPRPLGEDPGGLAELVAAFTEASGEDRDPVLSWLVAALSGPAGAALAPAADYDVVMDALRAGPLRAAGSPDGRTVRARLRRLWTFGEEILED